METQARASGLARAAATISCPASPSAKVGQRGSPVSMAARKSLASMMIWDFRDMVGKHAEIQSRLDQLVAERTGG